MKRFAFATALLLAPLTSIACKCIDYAVYLEKSGAARGLLDSKNVVVFQGRVKEVGTHATKEIDVIRWISGAEISRVWAQRGPAEMCGTSFVSGEEALFVAYSGIVSACGKLPPTKELIQALVSQAGSAKKNPVERPREVRGENVIRTTIIIEPNK